MRLGVIVDILMRAAESWINLSKKIYIVTYGKSKKLYTVKIAFEKRESDFGYTGFSNFI